MTDAREIIADYLREAKHFSPTTEGNSALEIIHALHAAGFCILGPDEVDQVTVEKCIEATYRNAPAETDEWNVHRAWVLRGVDAIRAIGRKP